MAKVIVFGNSLVNTMGLIRSVGKTGRKVDLLMEPCVKSRCFVHCSKYVDKVHWLSRLDEALDVLRNEYCDEPEKPVILCGGDPMICLLDAHYSELKDHFCIFNARGEQGRINFFMDKSNQFPVAEKCGLKLIKTWHVRGGSALPLDIVIPCLIKGNNSTSSTKGDMCVCKSREELLSHLPNDGDCLVQEYIEKDFELDITGFSYNHGRNVFIPAVVRKIRESLTRQSDYIRLDSVAEYPNLEIDKIKAFVGEIGYEGIFSVEILCRHGEFYFLEINLRNDGVGCLYTAAGINYPLLWIQYNSGETIDESGTSAKLKSPVSLMSIWDVDNLFRSRVSFIRWVKEFLFTDAYFVLDMSDPKPFIYSTLIHAKQACKKVLRKCGLNIAR